MQPSNPLNRRLAPRSRRSRDGFVLVTVLICLTVVLALMTAWFRMIALERGAARERQARMQAVWLVESGLERAAARLAAEPAYQGETWLVPAEELGGHDNGEVMIRVEPAADQSQRRTIHVRADYPADPTRRHRSSKTIDVTSPTTKK